MGGLSLAKSGEASNGGRAVDNYAQYLSQDGAVQATLYVYMPTYADASLAAYMTDKAIMERFGSRTRRTAYEATRSATRATTHSTVRSATRSATHRSIRTVCPRTLAGCWPCVRWFPLCSSKSRRGRP